MCSELLQCSTHTNDRSDAFNSNTAVYSFRMSLDTDSVYVSTQKSSMYSNIYILISTINSSDICLQLNYMSFERSGFIDYGCFRLLVDLVSFIIKNVRQAGLEKFLTLPFGDLIS